MLDFEKQKQIEQNYFKGNARGKKLYKAFEDCIWGLPGYRDPKEEFNYPGMTNTEREQVFKDYSNIQKDESYEMEKSCKDMLQSKIAYDWNKNESGSELVVRDPSYLYKYIIIFGLDIVSKWAQELIDTVDHVARNTYTDYEGCTYNSIIYKKDLKK